jgi:predicted ester cyclase
MSTHQNKAVVRRVYDELINQENGAVIDEIFGDEVVIHDEFMGTLTGVASFKQLMSLFDGAFPGHRVEVEAMIAEGPYVAVLHTHTATHTGPFMHISPSGKQILVNGIELFRLEAGKIVEFWRKDDDVSLLMQLGAMPAPAAA